MTLLNATFRSRILTDFHFQISTYRITYDDIGTDLPNANLYKDIFSGLILLEIVMKIWSEIISPIHYELHIASLLCILISMEVSHCKLTSDIG